MDEAAEIQGIEEENVHEPKISLTEALFIGFIILVLDIIDLIPIAGDFTDLFTLPINFYLHTKGVGGTAFVIAQLLDLIPIIQEFPSRSIAWWITIYIDRHPSRATSAIEKVGELAEKAEVGAGAAEGAVEGAAAEGGGVAAEGASAGAAGAGEAASGEAPALGGEAGEMGVESEAGEGSESSEASEKAKKNREIDKEMESGAETPPEEEMREKLFNPEEAQFREAEGPTLRDRNRGSRTDDDSDEQEEGGEDEEDEGLKKAA